MATRYLVAHPKDVEGLRYRLGHLSDDVYRVYAAEAGRIISEVTGRDSLYEAMDQTAPRPRLRVVEKESGQGRRQSTPLATGHATSQQPSAEVSRTRRARG